MQIAASAPKFLKTEEVPSEELKDLNDKGKSDYFKAYCLLQQPFIKDDKLTIQDYLTSLVAKIGENIIIRKFSRFKIGE